MCKKTLNFLNCFRMSLLKNNLRELEEMQKGHALAWSQGVLGPEDKEWIKKELTLADIILEHLRGAADSLPSEVTKRAVVSVNSFFAVHRMSEAASQGTLQPIPGVLDLSFVEASSAGKDPCLPGRPSAPPGEEEASSHNGGSPPRTPPLPGKEPYLSQDLFDPVPSGGSSSSSLPAEPSPPKKKAKRGAQSRTCPRCREDFITVDCLKIHKGLGVCKRPCQADHNHQPYHVWFESMEEARDHLRKEQFDRTMVISNGDRGAFYLRCFLKMRGSRKQNPKAAEDGGQKRRRVERTPENCQAQLRVKKATDGKVLVSGCLRHSHAQSFANSRFSALQKEAVDHYVSSGLRPAYIYNFRYGTRESNCDSSGKPLHAVARKDIYNRQRSIDGGYLRKLDVEGVLDLCRSRKEILRFSLPGYVRLRAAEEKAITTDSELFIMIQTEEQRDLFRRHPHVLVCDTTHGTNKYNVCLMVLLVLDQRFEGRPVFYFFGRSESYSFVELALAQARSVAPEEMSSVQVVVADLSRAIIGGAKAHFARSNQEVKLINCSFHVDRAWKSNIKSEEVLGRLKDLRLEGDRAAFMAKLNMLHTDYSRSKKHGEAYAYFSSNYLWDGRVTKPEHWARCMTGGAPTTSISLERFFATVKSHLKPSSRLDTSIRALDKVNQVLSNKSWRCQEGIAEIAPSRAQERFAKSHPRTSTEQIRDISAEEGKEEVLFERCRVIPCEYLVCDRRRCKVTCPSCEKQSCHSCAHVWQCSCGAFTFSGACSHIHLAAQLFSENNKGELDTLLSFDPRRNGQPNPHIYATLSMDSPLHLDVGKVVEAEAAGRPIRPPAPTERTQAQCAGLGGPTVPPATGRHGSSQEELAASQSSKASSAGGGCNTEAFSQRELEKEISVAISLAPVRSKTRQGRRQMADITNQLSKFNCRGDQKPPPAGSKDEVIGNFPDLRTHIKRKGGRKKAAAAAEATATCTSGAGQSQQLRDNHVRYALEADPGSNLWAALLSFNATDLSGRVEATLKVQGQRDEFWRRHEEAQKIHRVCTACNGGSNMEKYIGGYVECELCRTWVHQAEECSGLKKPVADGDSFVCRRCLQPGPSKGFSTPWKR